MGNPLLFPHAGNVVGRHAGVPIYTSVHLMVEDWSEVRSPSRARRRLRRGFRQRIKSSPDPSAYQTPQGIYMHPETLAEFERLIAKAPSP